MIAQEGPPDFVVALIGFGIMILAISSAWRVFTKAGKEGWAALIPLYNIIVLLEIAGKPLWWILLLCIPLVNIIVSVLIFTAVAKNFGKSAAFGIGLAFLGIIFVPILAFGDAEYQGVEE